MVEGESLGVKPGSNSFVQLARESAIFATGSLAGKAIGFLMLPILTRALTTAEFGRLDVLSTLVSAAVSALLLGLDVAATRIYPDIVAADRRGMFATWFTMSTALVLAPSAALIVLAAPLSRWFFGDGNEAVGFAMAGAAIVTETWFVIGLTVFRSQRRASRYALVNAGTLALNAILAIILLVVWESSVAPVMVAMVASQLVGSIVALLVLRRDVIAAPSRRSARGLLRLALPLAPAVVATWVGEFANRTILLGGSGATEVGYFSVAIRFSSVAILVVGGFHLAWEPHAFAAGAGPDSLRRLAVEARRIVVSVSSAVVVLAVVAPELLVLIAGNQYQPALATIGLELIYALMAGLFVVATMPSALARKMGDIGMAGTLAVGATLGLNMILSPVLGSEGTGAAMAGGQALGVAVAVVLGHRRLDTPIPWVRLLALTGGAVLVVMVATFPAGGARWWVRAGLGVAFSFGLLLEGTVREAFRVALRYYRRWRIHGSSALTSYANRPDRWRDE